MIKKTEKGVETLEERYYTKYAAAAIRGNLIRTGREDLLDERLLTAPLDELSATELEAIISLAQKNGIKTYYFKKSDRRLPRVNKVLGFLKGIYFENILDVGSGRGVFLLPFLEEFPSIRVQSLDILEKRYQLLSDISRGGVSRLSVGMKDICAMPFPEKSFDVVTMLEVLEHIPNVEAAITSAVKLAKEYVVITVPSKEDDNPEHIHLLTKERLTDMFMRAGAKKLVFDSVPCHLFMVAKL